MFKTSGRESFLIILFQFHKDVVLSGGAFALFHWHFYCDSFTREEDCIQNLLCTQRTFGNYWAFDVFSGPDLIANLSDGLKLWTQVSSPVMTLANCFLSYFGNI